MHVARLFCAIALLAPALLGCQRAAPVIPVVELADAVVPDAFSQ